MVRATPGANGGLLVLEPAHGRRSGVTHATSPANGKRPRFARRRLRLPQQGAGTSAPWLRPAAGGPSPTATKPLAACGWSPTTCRCVRPAAARATRGMVSLDLPLATLTDSFESLANLPGWRVSLVAPAGTLAANPEPGVALTGPWTITSSAAAAPTWPKPRTRYALRQPRTVQPRDARSGERRYTVVEPVGDSGWSLLVAQSYELIMARLNRGAVAAGAVGALLALLSMLVVRRLAKRISRPVEAPGRIHHPPGAGPVRLAGAAYRAQRRSRAHGAHAGTRAHFDPAAAWWRSARWARRGRNWRANCRSRATSSWRCCRPAA